MTQIPGTELFEFNEELVEMKAREISRKMNLPYDKVLELVDRFVIREPIHAFEFEPDEVETGDLLYYMDFEPRFDEALKHLKHIKPQRTLNR